MTIYLIEAMTSDKAFVNKQLAEEYLEEINPKRIFRSCIKPIELVTDQFMEQILQPKENQMKLIPTQVYNKLVHLQILTGSTMRQSNIFAVKFTWFYYNNQSEFLV